MRKSKALWPEPGPFFECRFALQHISALSDRAEPIGLETVLAKHSGFMCLPFLSV
jgi:hypothetical protein